MNLYRSSYTRGVTIRRLVASSALAALSALLLPARVLAAPPAQAAAPHAPADEGSEGTTDAPEPLPTDSDSAADKNPNSPIESARQGIVILERAGKILGLGSVLAGDGRILTALSPLGHGNNIDARFADGSVSQVKMGQSDRAWDLALVVPQNARWKKGLRASRVDPTKAGTNLRTFSVGANKDFALARTLVKGKSTLLGGDSELLQDALELVTRIRNTDLGSPVLDENGDVVAIVARACAAVPNQPCVRVPYGVPVSAIKAFLRTVPANAVPPAPWLGIQGIAEDLGPARGVRVLGVHPKSPAGAAGLKAGPDKSSSDAVVAVDGLPVMTPEALAQTLNQHAVGDSVQLLVFGQGKFRQITVQLRAAPESTRAALKPPAPEAVKARRPAPPNTRPNAKTF
jgi:serine protease Do